MPNTEPKKRKGCLIPLAVFAVALIAIIGGIAAGIGGAAGQKPKSPLAETMGLTEQQEQDLLEVFDACGILEVKEVAQFKEGESQTSYHVRDVETDRYRGMDGTIVVWLDNGTKAVDAIYFDDYDIYVDGAVVAQVPSFYVSAAQCDEYRVSIQLLAKERLSYPDSAQFGSANGPLVSMRTAMT